MLVQGPPGTGKTTTIKAIVQEIEKKCKRIMICTPSNNAVDHIFEKLASKYGDQMVRIGSIDYSPADSIKHLSLEYKVNKQMK